MLYDTQRQQAFAQLHAEGLLQREKVLVLVRFWRTFAAALGGADPTHGRQAGRQAARYSMVDGAPAPRLPRFEWDRLVSDLKSARSYVHNNPHRHLPRGGEDVRHHAVGAGG